MVQAITRPNTPSRARVVQSAAARKARKTKGVIAAHRRAYARLIPIRIKYRKNPLEVGAIRILEIEAMPQPSTQHYRIITHDQIDDLCEGYIKHCQKKGKWGHFHDPKRGTLDGDGNFRAGGDGPQVVAPQEGPEFNLQTLKSFRDRIADYHQRLNDARAKATQRNLENGKQAIHDAYFSELDVERSAWCYVLDRLAKGTGRDRAEICRYVRATLNRDLHRTMLAPATDRYAGDDEFAFCEEVVFALASPRYVTQFFGSILDERPSTIRRIRSKGEHRP